MGETFGQRLQKAMIDAKIGTTRLSQMLETNQPTVSQWRFDKVIPRRKTIAKLAEVLGVTVQWLEYGESVRPLVQPLEDRPLPRNDRSSLQIFPYARRAMRGTKPVQGWAHLAAGPGREVERAETPIYMFDDRLPADCGWFKVHGDSMIETLRDSDVVVVRDLGQRGIVLPPLGPDSPKAPLAALKQRVPDRSIAVLSIDGSELTVKRVNYNAKGNHWHLTLTADNPYTPHFPYVLAREDEITFWALVIGVGRPISE
jgi:transcriptional regulator with XRE-family HTH domain